MCESAAGQRGIQLISIRSVTRIGDGVREANLGIRWGTPEAACRKGKGLDLCNRGNHCVGGRWPTNASTVNVSCRCLVPNQGVGWRHCSVPGSCREQHCHRNQDDTPETLHASRVQDALTKPPDPIPPGQPRVSKMRMSQHRVLSGRVQFDRCLANVGSPAILKRAEKLTD